MEEMKRRYTEFLITGFLEVMGGAGESFWSVIIVLVRAPTMRAKSEIRRLLVVVQKTVEF